MYGPAVVRCQGNRLANVDLVGADLSAKMSVTSQ